MLAVFATAVIVATDEASATLGGRLARLASVLPMVGAGATFLCLQQARVRGEIRAISAAGAGPVRAQMGMLLGGVTIGFAGAILAWIPATDLTWLFPTATSSATRWTLEDGVWHDMWRGVAVRAGGELEWSHVAGATPSAVRPSRAATGLSLAMAAVGFPLWSAAPSLDLRRGLVAGAVVGAAVVAFHLVAAGRVPAVALVVPPSLLVADSLIQMRRQAWA
jgi:hypothetical protein